MKSHNQIINPEIEEYISSLYPSAGGVLGEMERYSEEIDMPIVGNQVGRFLYQITLLSRSRTIFELGSGFGYSSMWFAMAAGKSGKILCTDFSVDNKASALGYFDKAGFGDRIEFMTGNSVDLLRESRDRFDIIFNDIDKEYYPLVIDLAYERLNEGGLLITDNVLWHGRVIGDCELASTRGVREFNRRMAVKEGFYTTIVPLRDGLSLSMKFS